MTAQSRSNNSSLPLDPLSEQSVLVPPFVNTIAVRLSWAASVDEAEALRLLSAPYYHDRVTEQDNEQLCVRFPFLALSVPATIADYTVALVALWLTIEEIYCRGAVMPQEIFQELMKRTATMQQHDCRGVAPAPAPRMREPRC